MGCQTVLSGLRLEPGDEIVTTDEEHFGLLGPLHVSGARVRVAATRGRTAARGARGCACGGRAAHAARRPLARVLDDRPHPSGSRDQSADSDCRCSWTGRSRSARSRSSSATATSTRSPGRSGCVARTLRARCTSGDVDALAVALPTYWSREAHEPDGTFEPVESAQRFDTGPIPVPSLAGLEVALQDCAAVRLRRRARDHRALPRAPLPSAST